MQPDAGDRAEITMHVDAQESRIPWNVLLHTPGAQVLFKVHNHCSDDVITMNNR